MPAEAARGVLSDPVFSILLASAPPPVSAEEAEALVRARWGVEGRAVNLACERDTNFHIVTAEGPGYALKISNPAEPPENTNFQTEALLWLERVDPGLPVPKMVAALDGRYELTVPLSDGRRSVVRLLTWVEGTPLARAGISAGMGRKIGGTLARLGSALREFDHAASALEILWDIKHAARLRPLVQSLPEGALRDQLLAELDRFETEVAPRLPELRQQVVHNDLNHHNLVVDPADPEQISGVLDFGDMVKTPLIVDVAVAASYLTHLAEDPLGPVCEMVAAYHAVTPLERREIEILRDLIVARLLTSIAITEWRAARYPHNADYILRNNGPARVGMARFATLPPQRVTAALLRACNME